MNSSLAPLLVFFLTCHLAFSQLSYVGRCRDPTCGVDLGAQNFTFSTQVNYCTTKDYAARFSGCSDGVKSLYFYWVPPATCVGGLQLPQPVQPIPCSSRCKKGQYFSVEDKTCKSCEPGQFSTGNNLIIQDFPYGTIPAQSNLYCNSKSTVKKPCESWRSRGDYIDSGNNNGVHSLTSEITMFVEVGENATASFEYWVSAEDRYDYLAFYTKPQDSVKQYLLQVSTQLTWSTFRFSLRKGYNELHWAYIKDVNGQFGEDMARIRNIRVNNIASVETQCNLCPKGTFSNAGAGTCTPCPKNSYSDEVGSPSCTPCPPHTISKFEGATECELVDTPCKQTDYYTMNSTCNLETKTLTATAYWILPHLCNASHPESVVLPNATIHPCEELICPAGQEFDAAEYKCKLCPAGQKSAQGGKCTPCSAGEETALVQMVIDSFSPSMFGTFFISNGCDGQCQSDGWRAAGSYLDSGLGNGIAENTVEFNVTTEADEQDAHVALSYVLSCNSGSFQVMIDKFLVFSDDCTGCADLTSYKVTPKLQLKPGTTSTVAMMYKTTMPPSSSDFYCDRAMVKQITLSGVGSSVGGATSCITCNPGFFSSSGSAVCTACPAGSFSSKPKSATCTACPANKYSRYPGSSSCFNCGKGMTSSPQSTICTYMNGTSQFVANFSTGPKYYDFRPLTENLHFNSIGSDVYLNLDATENTPCGPLFACRVDPIQRTIIDLGNSLAMESTPNGDLVLTLNNPRSFCNSTTVSQLYTTKVILKCSVNELPSTILYETPCALGVLIESPFACPLCTEEDWTISAGECQENNQQTIQWVKSPTGPTTCTFGVQKSGETEMRACNYGRRGVPSNVVAWIVVASVVVGIILVLIATAAIVAAIVLYRKHKRLYSKYQNMIVRVNDTHYDEM